MVKWDEEWVEALTVLFLVLGFIVSVLLQSALFSYISVVLSGFLAGRIYFIKRYKEPILPFVLMILGFLLGYLIGSFWASRVWIIIFFAAAFWLSYYLHEKRIITIFKSESFVK